MILMTQRLPYYCWPVFVVCMLYVQLVQAAPTLLSDTIQTPYKEAFTYLQDREVVHGYDDGTGKPYRYLTRAEALKVLIESQEKYQNLLKENITNNTSSFSDVDSKTWYAPYVRLGNELDIVTGYEDGTFRPHQELSVEEATVLLVRVFNKESNGDQALRSDRIENKADQWYTGAINIAISKNLIHKQDTLYLGAAITRGQFFTMLYRMMVIDEKGLIAFENSKTSTSIHKQLEQEALKHASDLPFAITMPSLEVYDLPIKHPDDPFTDNGVLEVLKEGVGHLFGYPGEEGKILIYGHSSSYAWDVSEFTKIFREINNLKRGSKIYITYNGRVHVYQAIYEQTISASDTSYFTDNETKEELILYTCWPPLSITQRYLVHAVPVIDVEIPEL